MYKSIKTTVCSMSNRVNVKKQISVESLLFNCVVLRATNWK